MESMLMFIRRRSDLRSLVMFAVTMVVVVCFQGLAVGTDQATPGALWSDFNHYVRIARTDLAAASAKLLLQADPQKLLDAVEAGDYRDNYLNTLERAGKTKGLSELAKQLGETIQQARITRSREPNRILEDIRKLAGGNRENLNATERLRAAGQFAAPLMLRTLLDETQANLHPFVLKAMVNIGRPMIVPLATAMPHLDARPLAQVAQVLGEIGYAPALPYLKQTLETAKLDNNTKATVERAYVSLATKARVPQTLSAADLFLRLGQNYYTSGTSPQQLTGMDNETKGGVVWTYDREAGLVAINVPASIYADVLAMKAAQQALELSPNMDQALSLWLMANLRRAQRLGDATDPTYPAKMQSPVYYLRMAGPLRQYNVLARALADDNAAMALTAIDALADTSGASATIGRSAGSSMPLVAAMHHPDRRVRIRAALVLASGRATQAFEGSDRVVRVLNEAIRPSETKYALILSMDQEAANMLAVAMKDMGFQTIAGTSLESVVSQINSAPAIDVIVTRLQADTFSAVFNKINEDYRLASVPVLNVSDSRSQIEISRRYELQARKPLLVAADDAAAFAAGVQKIMTDSVGASLSEEENTRYALTTLKVLHDLALAGNSAYKVLDAQSTLIRTLDDKREEVALGAAGVLSLLNTSEAQQALAEVALDVGREMGLRVAILNTLSESATHFGNKLTEIQTEKLLNLATSSQGDLAVAAARAHGALSLPAGNVVKLLGK